MKPANSSSFGVASWDEANDGKSGSFKKRRAAASPGASGSKAGGGFGTDGAFGSTQNLVEKDEAGEGGPMSNGGAAGENNDSDGAGDGGERLVWGPTSSFRVGWTLMIMLLSVYNFLVIPFRTCLIDAVDWNESPETKDRYMGWMFADYALDVLLFVDFYFQLDRFGFLNPDGTLNSNPRAIRRRYWASTWLLWDALAILPLDIFAPLYSDTNLDIVFALRLPRVLRVFRIHDSFSFLTQFIEEWRNNVNTNVIVLIDLLFTYLIVLHGYTCFFFITCRYSDYGFLDNLGIRRASLTARYLIACVFASETLNGFTFGTYGWGRYEIVRSWLMCVCVVIMV